MALILALNNGAFATLAFIGVNTQSNASAATTPAVSLDQSTTKYVAPTSTYPGHTYINGDLNQNNSNYAEGDCVPFRVQLTNLDAAATSESVVIQYEHFRAGNYGYWSIGEFAVDLGSNGIIDAVTITTSPLPSPNDTTADQVVTVSFAPGGATSATLYYCGVLSLPANGHGGISSISGAPVHMRVLSGAQTVGGVTTTYSVGNQDRSIQPASITPFATLSITKTTSTTSVAVGGTATYTITVTNAASASLTATGVQITDTLPSGFTYASTGAAGGTGTRTATVNPTAGQTSLTFGTWSLAPGQTASVTFTANVGSTCGSFDNNAAFTSTNGGSGSTSSPATVTVTGCTPSLSITKTTSTSSVALGGAASFTITVTNSASATATATGVTLSDTLPAGFTFASGTSGGTGTRTATTNPSAGQSTLAWGTWSLAPGQTATATFTATAPSAANSCGSYANNAGYSSTNAGSGSTSTPATVTVTGCTGNLSITKTTSTSSVALGGAATFTITVTNNANATLTATGVQITDTLPSGFTYASTGAAGGTGSRTATINPTAGDTSLTFGTWSLAPGQTASVTFTATAPSAANACGAYNNNASASSGNDGSATTASPATVTVTGCTPSLSITKTTSTSSVALGGAASFTITVTNSASATATATGVTLSDTLPAGFTFASGTSGGTGTRTATTNPSAGQSTLAWGTWSLAPGQTATATFTATAPSAANSCGSYANNAGYSSTNAGSGSTSTPATVTVTGCTAGLSITKTTSTATVLPGGTASFQIQVANAATATLTATGVQITDTLPAGFTYAATGTSTGGTRTATVNPAAGDTTLTFGTWSIAPGATVTVNFTATAPSGANACGAYDNNASFTSGNDGSGSTTTAATVTVLCPDVSVLKTAGSAISAGSTASFTIVVTAGGTGSSSQVLLTDSLPAGHTWTVGGPDAAACQTAAGVLTCDFGTMTNGSTRTITLTAASTSADCEAGISNTATVSAAVDVDTSAQSNSSTATQTVNCGQISVSKTADHASVAAGSAIGFLITATNSGAGTATSATVTDTLPTTAGTSWSIDAAGSDTGCSITSGILTCNFGDLASNASKHVHLTSPTTLASCGTVNNTATVRTGNDGTSTASASVSVVCPPPPPALGAIQVTKYNDTNRNGARDAGEPALQGFVFTVRSGTTIVATVTTDATGNAVAANLGAGTYTVTETQQTGWTSTDPGASLTKTVTVSSGQTATLLFGNAVVQLPPTSAGTLVVTKYNDLNANKSRDTNEPALSGWTFTVKNSSGATVGTAATDASGNATFSDLGFGTYTVTETLQTGWTSTDPGGASPTKTVTIAAASTTVLFGNAKIKLPNTSTLEAPSQTPSPAMLFLLTVLLAQAVLLTIVFRRWRNDS